MASKQLAYGLVILVNSDRFTIYHYQSGWVVIPLTKRAMAHHTPCKYIPCAYIHSFPLISLLNEHIVHSYYWGKCNNPSGG